jgi:hypothetical protein
MALESGELVAEVIVRHADKIDKAEGVGILCSNFAAEYRRKFDSRLRVSGAVRQLAYKPALAQLAIDVCGSSERFRSWLARATRSSARKHAVPAGLK